jgi:hypothetical protein
MSAATVTVPKEFETAEGLRTLANFLRSQNGIRVKSGIEHEKRVDYFKGNVYDICNCSFFQSIFSNFRKEVG